MTCDILRDIYMETPLGSCEESSIATLYGLAYEGYFDAVQSLTQLISFEFDRQIRTGEIEGSESIERLIGITDIPPFVRIYALGFYPEEFTSAAKSVASWFPLDSPHDPKGRGLTFLQELIRRDSPMQHQALKAVVLVALARHISSSSTPVPAEMQAHMLDLVMTKCHVVKGGAATSDLAIGRDLILQASHLSGLLMIFIHELAHTSTRPQQVAGDSSFESYTGTSFVRELISGLHEIVERLNQDRLESGQSTKGHLYRYPWGMSLYGTYHITPSGSATRFSIMNYGGTPISLENGARCGISLLDSLRVNPQIATVAYSRRGAFHFGFEGPPPKASELDTNPARVSVNAAREDMPTEWIAELRRNRRFGDSELTFMRLLKMLPDEAPFFAQNRDWSRRDVEGLAYIHNHGIADLDPEMKLKILKAAIRVGDRSICEKSLAAGTRASQSDLTYLGYSLCASEHQGEIIHFVPTPEDVLSIIALLHKSGLDCNSRLEMGGDSYLCQAAIRSPKATQFLLSIGADPAKPRADGSTPLLLAARFGTLETVRVLLAADAPLESRDDIGLTALAAAVERDDEKLVGELLTKGADPNTCDSKGRPALMNALSARMIRRLAAANADLDAQGRDGRTALIEAAYWCRLDLLEAMLLSGADPGVCTDQGMTALHFASWSRQEEPNFVDLRHMHRTDDNQAVCIDALLKSGAPIEEETRDGLTALMFVCRRDKPKLAERLLASGAKVNNVDRSGNTALHYAAQAESASLVELLLRFGADPAMRNNASQTPSMFSRSEVIRASLDLHLAKSEKRISGTPS